MGVKKAKRLPGGKLGGASWRGDVEWDLNGYIVHQFASRKCSDIRGGPHMGWRGE